MKNSYTAASICALFVLLFRKEDSGDKIDDKLELGEVHDCG